MQKIYTKISTLEQIEKLQSLELKKGNFFSRFAFQEDYFPKISNGEAALYVIINNNGSLIDIGDINGCLKQGHIEVSWNKIIQTISA